MDLQIIISVLGLLGIGGVIGGYFQHLLSQRRETDLKIQSLNEGKYRSILIFMRCVLKPENVNQFSIDDQRIYKLKKKEEIKKFAMEKLAEYYYNSLLYASDEVLIKFKQFISEPSEYNFMEAAIAMRKDLWKKVTKIKLNQISLE